MLDLPGVELSIQMSACDQGAGPAATKLHMLSETVAAIMYLALSPEA